MKKTLLLAIALCACGCYAPLNNSGLSTNKAWLEIPAKKTNFDGKTYDICYQFNLRFVPAEASAQLDLQRECVDFCCWLSEREEVVLYFNKNFEENLSFYGRAEKYTPNQVTLRMTYSPLLNTAAVHVTPRGAVNPDGTLKLKHQLTEDPARLAQLEEQSRRAETLRAARLSDPPEDMGWSKEEQTGARARAIDLVQRQQSSRIDSYFYLLDKQYRQKGYVFLISRRIYAAAPLPDGNYQVTCHAQVQTGVDAQNLQNRTLSCGTWKANPSAGTVTAQDSVARKIKAQ